MATNTATILRSPQFQWDKITSTYWWRIKLNADKNIVKFFDGYSHAEGYDEAQCKKSLLRTKVIMLHSNGYFDRADSIEFYRRVGDVLDKKRSQLLFIIAANDLREVDDDYFLNEDRELMEFFHKLYRIRREGGDVKQLLPPRNKGSKDDYLNIDVQFPRIGNSQLKLNGYFNRLLKNGHAPDAVTNFYIKYKEKFFK